jgi:nucleoside-diphosphate-sugar epimerase
MEPDTIGESMRVLVIGGSGFIGSFLSNHLEKQGDIVAALDLFLSDQEVETSLKAKIEGHRSYLLRNVATYKADVCKLPQLLSICMDFKPTHIVNLASFSLALAAEKNAFEAIDLATTAIKNIFTVALSNPVEKIVYLSSSYVYGNFKSDVLDEEQALAPINVYGRTKQISEIMHSALSGAFGINFIILRPISVYGVGDFNGKFSSKNLKNWISSGKLALHGDAKRTNSVTHIADMCGAISLVLESKVPDNRIYNVTSDEHLTNADIKGAFSHCGYQLSLSNLETTKIVVPKRGQLSTKKIRAELNYSPQHKFQESLPEMISFALA